MTEKNEELEDDEKVVDKSEEEVEEEEYDEVEQEAMKKGWNPEGPDDPDKRAISAQEFLDRQKLYDDLRKRGRENKKLQRAVEDLKASHKIVAEQAYKRAKRELEREKRLAYDEGDTSRAMEIDKEMSELEADQKKISSEEGNVDQQATEEAYNSFREANPWYDSDPELRGYADLIGQGLISQNPQRAQEDPEGFFEQVAAEVKNRFADKFEGEKRVKRRKANAVEGDRAGGKRGTKHTLKDLPEEHREVAKRIIESGVMTQDEYLNDYFSS